MMNLPLRRENVRLQSELETARSTIEKLETRISELQGKKSSLMMVISILQKGN